VIHNFLYRFLFIFLYIIISKKPRLYEAYSYNKESVYVESLYYIIYTDTY